MVRTRNNKKLDQAGSLAKREAILAALAKATTDCSSSGGPSGELDGDIKGYYTLSLDELTALVNGDMEKIENWVSNLDRRRATWLLRWLIKDR